MLSRFAPCTGVGPGHTTRRPAGRRAASGAPGTAGVGVPAVGELTRVGVCNACGARMLHEVVDPVTYLCDDCFGALQADAVAPFDDEAARLGRHTATKRWVDRLLAGGMTLSGVELYFDVLGELCEQEAPR